MYPHGARPNALTPSLSRPRIIPIPASLPVPLHVTSSRKVHRSADGIINIIQEISFYADGFGKSLAGKLLNEVHCHPAPQERGRFSAETNARVFVGERLIRMHIQTSIRPNSSDSLEFDEVFHFAENQDALVVPISFEPTLERAEGERPAVEFDLSSPIVVTLKQRILKDSGEQYKVLQAIELRANETEARPIQELARKSTITQPSNETAQFRERIFAGTDVLRVDRDILFVCDRQILSLSERREYMPEYPMAPRRRSASLTQSAPRVRHTPDKPRSRSQSRTRSEDSENCHTANEDLPTATSPYSLREEASCGNIRTARDVSPISSCPASDRESRSKRKKWTVNSKSGAVTPDRSDRARTMRNLSTALNLSMSPLNRSENLPTARGSSPNGEIPAVQAIPIMPNIQLGPHGECTLVEGMEVLKVAAPADSLIRTCNQDCSPTRTRSASGCSTASQIPTCFSTNNNACQSPPFSSPRPMPGTAESSVPSTPLRTALDRSPHGRREPSSAALNKRRVLFGYGTRPATTPTRSARARSPSSALNTGLEASPMHTARRVVMSPVQTAVSVAPPSSRSNSQHSRKSQKQSHKESKHSGKRRTVKPRLIPLDDRPADYHTSSSSSTNLGTARNLFGTVSSNESVARMFSAQNRTPTTPRTGREASRRSPAISTAYARSITVSPEHTRRSQETQRGDRSPGACPNRGPQSPTVQPLSQPIRIEKWSTYDNPEENKFGNHGPTERTSPFRPARTERSVPSARTAAEYSPARGMRTALQASPMSGRVPKPRQLFGDVLNTPPGDLRTARPHARSPYARAEEPAQERSAPSLYYSGEKTDEPRTARAHSYHDGTTTARSPAQSLKTGRQQSPYGTMTAREPRSQAQSLKTGRQQSPYGTTTARESRSPAQSLKTGRQQSPYEKTALSTRSPARSTMTGRQLSPFDTTTAREARTPAQSLKTGRQQSPYDKTCKSHASPARALPTARGHTDRSPALVTARQSPYDKSARSPALNTATLSPYEQNVLTARSARSPARSMKTARQQSPYGTTTARESRSPAQALKTGRQQSPYDTTTAREARSPAQALKTGRQQSPYGTTTARESRSPAQLLKTGRQQSPYERTARSPADGIRTALPSTTNHSPGPRSLYLAPQMAQLNAAPPAGDPAYTHVITARAVTPVRSQGVPSPHRSTRTARAPYDAYSPGVQTARDALNSTKSCISGGVDSDAKFTARSARSPSMVTSRDVSMSPVRTARSGYAAPTTTPVHGAGVMQHLPDLEQQRLHSQYSPQQRTAVYGGGMDRGLATSRTQSPATRSDATANMRTAQGARSPHVDTESPTHVVTARVLRSPATLRTACERSRGAASPANLKTGREMRSSASRSPSASRQQLRTAATRTPEHNTMPDSHLRQEDSYSEQSQFTFQKTASGFTQKPTHPSEMSTGQQRTPTKTDNNTTVYYSARQTTPTRSIRPNDVTLTQRTPKRDYSQHAGLEEPSPVRTAVDCTTPSKKKQYPKLDEMPKCSLKTGCQATHAPRKIPAGPDSDGQDSPSRRVVIAAKTPERSVRTARGPTTTRTPVAPYDDMRTPRTARATRASPASSLHRSPAPTSNVRTAVSPDAESNSNNSNEEMNTARHQPLRPRPSSPGQTTARNWAAATEGPAVTATAKPRIIVRANQADGKIHVEVCLSFKMNTTGTIRLRGEMVPALQPRTVSVNGQQIWSNRN